MFSELNIPISNIAHSEAVERELQLNMLRLDQIHPEISGNKWFKLKYNLESFKKGNYRGILTFGGAYSNHLAATAYTCKKLNIPCAAIVRGDELKTDSNDTLNFLSQCGMQLQFFARSDYKNKQLLAKTGAINFPNFFQIPDGGSNAEGYKGCKEIAHHIPNDYNFVVCDCGTGVTSSSILSVLPNNQKLIVFSVLKGASYLKDEILSFENNRFKKEQFVFNDDFHFGGFGIYNESILNFIKQFYREFNIKLEQVYSAKMLYGLLELIKQNYFPKSSKILVIHSGGIQGAKHLNLYPN